MPKSIRISDSFHPFIKSHKREDRTMEETLRRLIGEPHPEEKVARMLSSETTAAMRERLGEACETDDYDECA